MRLAREPTLGALGLDHPRTSTKRLDLDRVQDYPQTLTLTCES
jgi:hypothetical protein